MQAATAQNITHIRPYSMSPYNQKIETLYRRATPQNRINFFSRAFLNKAYQLDPLGEGAHGKFDQQPLYRTDEFDCMTYVSTVLALAQSHSLKEFQKNILKIRYQHGLPSYIARNHFTSIDWNRENEQNHFVKDITKKIYPRAKTLKTTINISRWYQTLSPKTIKLIYFPSKLIRAKLLFTLHNLPHKNEKVVSKITYIPIHALLQNPNILNSIPTPSSIEIVAHLTNMKKRIGTQINIVHMGIAIQKDHHLIFREASSRHKKVTDIVLVDYLKHLSRFSSIKGIHVEQIIFPSAIHQ